MVDQNGDEFVDDNEQAVYGTKTYLALILVGLGFFVCLPIAYYLVIYAPEEAKVVCGRNTLDAGGQTNTLFIAQEIYFETVGNGQYGTGKELFHANYIGVELSRGEKDGYVYEMGWDNPQNLLWVKASPIIPGKTGTWYYFRRTGGRLRSFRSDFEIDKQSCQLIGGADENRSRK